MNTSALTEQERALIEHACARLVLESVAANDRQDYEAFADLFTSDGLLHRPSGPPLVGRDEIIDSYRSRPRNRMTRHVCSNIIVTAESTATARGLTYVVLYSADALRAEGPFGAKCDPRTLIGELEDAFRLTASGWRIAERRARFVMHT
ncbi:MAG TPA: nuclear transport factor 2 family protein [Gammaproteobacteria bacterium]